MYRLEWHQRDPPTLWGLSDGWYSPGQQKAGLVGDTTAVANATGPADQEDDMSSGKSAQEEDQIRCDWRTIFQACIQSFFAWKEMYFIIKSNQKSFKEVHCLNEVLRD